MMLSGPPKAATWLLKSLTPGSKSEALLGDLEEDFVRGRSAAWYWRQVFVAILVSFAQELRCRWIATAFAALWTAVVFLFLQYFYTSSHIRPLFNTVFGWTVGFAFPISTIFGATIVLLFLSALETLAGLIGIGIYLVTRRSLTLRGVFRTASTVLAILFSGNIVVAAIVLLAAPANLARGFVGYMIEALFVFVSLLVAVWAPSVENTRAKSIPA